MKKQRFFILSHTHWDREWYQPFQDYRYRLVRLMDDLLELMESQPEYPYFHLDGQTIVLEDYLAIRPENESRLRKLIAEGRVLIGPWYVMPDEFLVSGESLVRNLQKGHQICNEYTAKPMKNGYVTDIFGHNAQFPQILKGFGIDTAILFRGVGDYPKDAFAWEGADGSRVTVFRLDRDRCYSNFYFSLRWPFESREIDWQEFAGRAAEMLERSRKAGTCDVFLLMDGVDHIDAEHQLPKMIDALNGQFGDIEVRQARMEDYIAAFQTENPELDTLCGPLYNVGKEGLNNIVLKNVLSSMVHLKQANAACEDALTGWAETFDFASEHCVDKVMVPGVRHAQPRSGFLKEAWKLLLSNHPHDSICGCSVTAVHQDNEYRIRQVVQIAERMTRDALECIAERVDTSGREGSRCFVVFNPAQDTVSGTFTLTMDLPPDAWKNFRLYDAAGSEIPYQILDISPVWKQPVHPLNTLISFQPRQTLTLALKTTVPALGYALVTARIFSPDWMPGPGVYRMDPDEPTRYPGSMRTAPDRWDNGVLEVCASGEGFALVCKETGRFYPGLLTLEDTGDSGDGWNYIKPPMDCEVLGRGGQFTVLSDGPFAAVLQWVQTLSLPLRVDNGSRRSTERRTLSLTTTATVLKDNPRIEFKTTLDNHIEDHRLRVLFPTGYQTDRFYTQTPFDMQPWQVKKADWSKHKEIDTLVNPMQGSLYIAEGKDCLELYSKGLYETEVMERDCTVALTLFRAFPNEVEQPHSIMGELQRSLTLEYALRIGTSRSPADAMRESRAWRLGLKSIETGIHAGIASTVQSFVEIDSKTALLTALTCEENGGILRLCNPSDQSDQVTLRLCKPVRSAERITLEGNPIEPVELVDGAVTLPLRPHGIETIRFDNR